MRKTAFCTILLVLGIFLLAALPAAAAPRYTCLDLNTVQFPGYTVYSTHPRGITQDGTVAGYGDIESTQSAIPSRRGALAAPLPQSGVTKSAAFLFNLIWGVGGIATIHDTDGVCATYAEAVRCKSGAKGSPTMGQSSGSRPYYETGVWQDSASPYYHHAFLYDADSGTFTALGNLGGSASLSQSYANGVNDAGQAVGYSYTASGTQHAFLYSGSMQDLFPGDSNSSDATGINNAGQVVGVYNGSAFLLTGGVGGVKTDLGTKLNPPYIYNSYATAINTTGQVAGYSSDTSGFYHAFLYDGVLMHDLGSLGGPPNGYLCQALALNDAGQVVGYSQTATAGDVHAFLYSGGVMYDLNILVQNLPAGVVLTAAYGINDRGQIVADGGIGGYSGHGYLLTPCRPLAALDLLLQ